MFEKFSAAATTEIEPWVRLTLAPVQPYFTRTVREAQAYSAHLRRIRIISSERCQVDQCAEAEAVTVLVPQELVRQWQTPAPGEWDLEYQAASYLLSLANAVLENRPDAIPF